MIFYKNIETEICEILSKYFKNKPEAEIVKKTCFRALKICKYNTLNMFPSGHFSQKNGKCRLSDILS